MVAFAHGSGSGRFSLRNQFVAGVPSQAGIATLLIDLLEDDEADDWRKVFDIALLASRLQTAADWMDRDPEDGRPPTGHFGLAHFGPNVLRPRRLAGRASLVLSQFKPDRPDPARSGLTRVLPRPADRRIDHPGDRLSSGLLGF